MKKRTYTGTEGRLSGHVLGRSPFAVPETIKICPRAKEAKRPDGAGELTGVSGDGGIWVFERGIYRWDRIEGMGERLSPLALYERKDLSLMGYDWALMDGALVLGGAFVPLELPFPMPDATNPRWWLEACDGENTVPFAPGLSSKESAFFGRWCYTPLELAYRWETDQSRGLRAAIASAKGEELRALTARLEEIERFDVGQITNFTGIYGMTWYDCYPSQETEMAEPSYGGLWIEEGRLYGAGSKTAGRGVLVPTSFASDGTCLGLSVVHSGQLQGQEPGYVIPTVRGAVHVAIGEGEPKGNLLPVKGPYSLTLWEEGKTRTYEIEGGFVSPRWGYMSLPGVLSLGEDKVSLWGLWEGRPSTLGGEAKTIGPWCFPGEAEPSDVAGPFMEARSGGKSIVTDMRLMRRHIVPGIGDIQILKDRCLVRSHLENEDLCQEVHSPLSPLLMEEGGNELPRFSQDVKPEHLSVPWRGLAGEPMEIGWWDWPELGVRGSPPNPAGLGDEDGSNDFYDGTYGDPRKGMSVTSDGLIYLSGDNYDDEAIDLMAWRHDGQRWESNRVSWPCAERLVAPYGQGNYQVHHFPGADWSLFHAPVGRIRYQKLLETTDWSFLSVLTGLGGGFALHNALMVQESFNKYLEQSFGNAMLIYTVPNQRLYVGDPMFKEWEGIDTGGQFFWTFAGWAQVRGEPMAVFSKLPYAAGNDPKPEVWGVCRSGARRLDPKEAGEIGEKAAGLIPSTYWSRWGLWPGAADGTGGLASEVSELILGNNPCLYPMPEHTGDPGAALAEDMVERMEKWSKKAQDINRPAVTVGQTYDHQILTTAAIDPNLPLVDARLEVDEEGVTWVMLRHWTGVWLSVRCDGQSQPHQMEKDTPWELLSLGSRDDGAIVGLFGKGICSLSIGDYDKMLELFGFGEWWTRFALHTWYARVMPVVIRQSPEELDRLAGLWRDNKEEEEEA